LARHYRPRGAPGAPRRHRAARRPRRRADPGRGHLMTRSSRLSSWLPALLLAVVVLALWEGASIVLGLQTFLLPRPSLIVGKRVELLPSPLARATAFAASAARVGAGP